MFCERCGKKLNKNKTCSSKSCPAYIDTSRDEDYEYFNVIPSQNILRLDYNFKDNNGIYAKEIEAFVGDKSTYYFLKQWTNFQKNKFFISWNWSAFFFSSAWFFHRKLYLTSVIIFSFRLLFFCLIHLILFNYLNLNETILIMIIISLFISTIIALIANQFYILHIIKKLRNMKTFENEKQKVFDNESLKYLRSIGGTSNFAITTFVVFLVIIFNICLYLFLFIFNLFDKILEIIISITN